MIVKLPRRQILRLAAGAATLPVLSGSARAQAYPDHPVRVLIGFAAGSGPDIQGRTVSQEIGNSLGQPFYVENRLGANGTIAARAIATSKPDGYSLLFSSSSIISTPYVYKNLGYDTLTDLTPIATIGQLDGLFMLVDANSPIKTLAELIARAKTERLAYGSPGVGNGLHLATEIFAKKAGIILQHIPYKGASEVMTALLGGSVQVMFVTPPSVMGLIKDGRVRPLAFTGTKPFGPTPDVPLMKDLLPGYEPQGSWGMFFAPGKTPVDIVDKLNSEVRKALRVPAVASIMQRDGYMPDERDAAATAVFFRKEVEQAAEAVKAAGIEPN
jgi:tripartite-type tricarboxylate transporter receptor subunit TctC